MNWIFLRFFIRFCRFHWTAMWFIRTFKPQSCDHIHTTADTYSFIKLMFIHPSLWGAASNSVLSLFLVVAVLLMSFVPPPETEIKMLENVGFRCFWLHNNPNHLWSFIRQQRLQVLAAVYVHCKWKRYIKEKYHTRLSTLFT